MWTKSAFVLFRFSNDTTLGKNVIFCWFRIPQVVQEQTLGEVGNWIVIWGPVVWSDKAAHNLTPRERDDWNVARVCAQHPFSGKTRRRSESWNKYVSTPSTAHYASLEVPVQWAGPLRLHGNSIPAGCLWGDVGIKVPKTQEQTPRLGSATMQHRQRQRSLTDKQTKQLSAHYSKITLT